jgi:signal transduction histidine kinase
MAINENHDLSYCNFSKNLIRKLPAFNSGHTSEANVTKVLSMSIIDFYSMIEKIPDNQSLEYVYPDISQDGERKYFLIKIYCSAVAERGYHCVGVVEDFSMQKAYSKMLDQMLFDISHVMRRPVVTMKGLTNLIDMDKFEKEDLKEICQKIKSVSEEMEEYIRLMFQAYEAKPEALYHL